MKRVRTVVGRALPLARANVDTDQIIPASFLKQVTRSGYAAGLFAAWRSDPAFVLNDERYRGATILVAGPNFGCGSSREHAVWALRDAGFAAIVSSGFADIFRANCVRNGLVPVTVAPVHADGILDAIAAAPRSLASIDVDARMVTMHGVAMPFDLADHERRRLLEGLDDMALALEHGARIDAFEARRPAWLPRTPAP